MSTPSGPTTQGLHAVFGRLTTSIKSALLQMADAPAARVPAPQSDAVRNVTPRSTARNKAPRSGAPSNKAPRSGAPSSERFQSSFTGVERLPHDLAFAWRLGGAPSRSNDDPRGCRRIQNRSVSSQCLTQLHDVGGIDCELGYVDAISARECTCDAGRLTFLDRRRNGAHAARGEMGSGDSGAREYEIVVPLRYEGTEGHAVDMPYRRERLVVARRHRMYVDRIRCE